MVPERVTAFAQEVVDVVRGCLGDQVVAVYLFGSVALDDWQRASSDIDMAVVATAPLAADALRSLADAVLATAAQAPARGLELVVYTEAQAAHPDGTVALNVNGGPLMTTSVDIDHADFWFVLDAAILRSTAVALIGPPAAEVFGHVADTVLRAALDESLAWHAEQVAHRPEAAVLAACRSWRFLADGRWTDKSEAAHWAAARSEQWRPMITAALQVRQGGTGQIDAGDAAAFVAAVRARCR